MGMTIAEKIIARAAGVSEVRPGDIHTVEVDRLMSNDGTTHLTIDMYHNKLKHPHIADVNKLVWIVDHNVPSDSPKTAASQKKMRDFAKEHGIKFYEGQGVCHQIMMENHVCPGELIFGADSHTCAYGALGAFGTGVGCTDYLYAMVTGKSWVLVPETLRFNLTGKLPEQVELIGLGTNALATAAMLKAGVKRGATGENAICISAAAADLIVGPIGIIIPNAMMGEITPRIAEAVGSAAAKKVLLPVSQNHFEIVGVEPKSLASLVKEAVSRILTLVEA